MLRLLSALFVALFPVFAAAPGFAMSAYDFEFEAIDGQKLPMSSFKGKAVLVVNTASQCGFTGQYAALQALWTKYRERRLVVLGVPSNDFGGQEPGSAEQIKEFCEANFDVNFPLTEKVAVKGEAAHPMYKWLAAQFGPLGAPRWNFHKYLIGPDGKAIDYFSTLTDPNAPQVIKAVEAALPKLGG